MKNLFSLFLLVLFVSCQNQDTDNVKPSTNPTELANLYLTTSETLVPVSQMTGKVHAIYVNSEGEEKQLSFQINSGMHKMKYKGLYYDAEFINVLYTDPSDLRYKIAVDASINYSQNPTTTEVVTATIVTNINPNFMSTVMLGAEGEPVLAKFLAEVTLAGMSFTNVYTDAYPNSLGYNSFAQTYYNTSIGIVGFQGENGEMWAFKRFE